MLERFQTMKIAFFAASMALVLAGQSAFAQEASRDKLYDLGWNICSDALDGLTIGLERSDYAEVVDSKNWERAEYCFCVAQEFQDLEADDLNLMTAGNASGSEYRNFMASVNLEYCLPGHFDEDEHGFGIDLGLDADVLDGDVLDEYPEEELPDENFEIDPGDVHMCNLALEDALMIPSFDLQGILEGMENSGQSREDMCGCVAQYFAAGGDQLDIDIENAMNPTIAYNSTLAGAFNICRL
jgi:hypothetical protein